MFCRKCGMIKDESCSNIYITKTQSNSWLKRLKASFLLSNRMVFILFSVSFVIILVGCFMLLGETNAQVSGFLYIFAPIWIALAAFPQTIGYLLSYKNLVSKKYWILILIFICGLISLWQSIQTLDNSILTWFSLCTNILLVLVILLKLVFKIKD